MAPTPRVVDDPDDLNSSLGSSIPNDELPGNPLAYPLPSNTTSLSVSSSETFFNWSKFLKISNAFGARNDLRYLSIIFPIAISIILQSRKPGAESYTRNFRHPMGIFSI